MSAVVLSAPAGVPADCVAAARAHLADLGPEAPQALAGAVVIRCARAPADPAAAAAEWLGFADTWQVDANWAPSWPADIRLACFDMDSTLIAHECIDELAAEAGVLDRVAIITERAMRGELDFRQALDARLALVAGLPQEAMRRILGRMHFNPGAEVLLAELNARGVHTLLVSGGFTFFARPVADKLGIRECHACELELADGRLTGRLVGEPVTGPVKLAHLQAAAKRMGLRPEQCLAAGDGANDLPMLQAAGFGVAFRGKPKVRQQARLRVDRGGLDAILHILGPRTHPAGAARSV